MSPFMLSRYLQVIHHTKHFIILDSKLCPDQFPPPPHPHEVEGNTAWTYCHRQPYCKAGSGCQACIVTLRDYLWGCEYLLRQKDNSSDLAKLWQQGCRESTVGRSESRPGPHNSFSSQEYWSLSEPLCGWFARAKVKSGLKQTIHMKEKERLLFSASGKRRQWHDLNY